MVSYVRNIDDANGYVHSAVGEIRKEMPDPVARFPALLGVIMFCLFSAFLSFPFASVYSRTGITICLKLYHLMCSFVPGTLALPLPTSINFPLLESSPAVGISHCPMCFFVL